MYFSKKSLRVVWLLPLALIWLLGARIYFGTTVWQLPLPEFMHWLIVSVISATVLGRAATARGSSEDRLKQAITATIALFGTYAFVILVGRHFFSRTIFATMVPITLALSLLILWLRQRSQGVKVAVIRPLVRRMASIPPGTLLVSDPQTDFRSFDVLVVDPLKPVSPDWSHALSRAMLSGCRVRHIEDYLEELSGEVSLDHFELEHLPSTEFASYILVKRIIDIAGAIILLPIVLPIILLATIAIIATSGWPPFFIQERVGYGGRPFRMWKLRTMRPIAVSEEVREAVPGDQRITPIGRVLRRFRIDELPQLWNVLKGDMSLTGPRPEAAPFHHAYTAVHPQFAYRCLVKPGISGWAQVNAPPSATADEALSKLRYDLFYVKHQSLSLDVQIAIMTIWTVLHGRGVR